MNSRLATAAAVTSMGSALSAQVLTPVDVQEQASQLVTQSEETPGCDISLHGAPRFDEQTGRWLVAYSGVGAACDDRGAALQQEGAQAQITFYRRPNSEEVMVLIGEMRASVRRGFPCLISFRGEPLFDAETGLWTLRYYTSGEECAEASNELERKGKTFSVAFHRLR